jgi:heme exporter protein A
LICDNKLLSIEALGYRYNIKKLFTDLSFFIFAGELIHLKGANGSGKTTLLELIAGLKEPQEGKIKWQQDSTKEQLRCSFLSAEFNGHFQGLNGVENLTFWANFLGHKVTKTSILKELDTWGLDLRIVDSCMEVKRYSTGMKKRLALARVFMFPTKVVVLDEPTNGLDNKGRKTFLAKLQLHLSSGFGAIVTSHEQNLFCSTKAKEVELVY